MRLLKVSALSLLSFVLSSYLPLLDMSAPAANESTQSFYAFSRTWGEHVDKAPICALLMRLDEPTIRYLLEQIEAHQVALGAGRVSGFPEYDLPEEVAEKITYYPLRSLKRRPYYKEYEEVGRNFRDGQILSGEMLSHAEPLKAEDHKIILARGEVSISASQSAVPRGMNIQGLSRSSLYRFLVLLRSNEDLPALYPELVEKAPEVARELLAGEISYMAPGGWKQKDPPQLSRSDLVALLQSPDAELRLEAFRRIDSMLPEFARILDIDIPVADEPVRKSGQVGRSR